MGVLGQHVYVSPDTGSVIVRLSSRSAGHVVDADIANDRGCRGWERKRNRRREADDGDRTSKGHSLPLGPPGAAPDGLVAALGVGCVQSSGDERAEVRL
jgi:hypothetical protein